MRVHKGKALIACVAALAIALTACSSSKSSSKGGSASGSGSGATAGTKGTGNFATCATEPNTCNTAAVKKGGTLTYVLEKTISGWDINTANSNTFETAELMDGLLPNAYITGPDLKAFLNTDLLASATQTSASPQTLVYKIQPGAVWSDGTPIDASDFDYQWKTNDGIHCPACVSASTGGYKVIKSLTPSDNGKTVTVVMSKPFGDWRGMFGTLYPAHLAAKHGDLSTPKGLAASLTWLDATTPAYSGGPFLLSAYVKNTSATQVPNPKWYGKVKPSLDKLIFRTITDQTQEVPALQNNEVQAIYPQPNADITQAVANLQGVDSYLGKGLQWEHLDFNTTNPLLSDKVLRTAIFTAVDRKQIIAKTIGQFVPNAQPVGNHMLLPSQVGYKDNVTATGQGSGDATKAKKMLTDAGYTGVGSALKNKAGKLVSIRCSFTTGNVLRQQTCQLLQSQLKALGITVTPTPLDSLGDTLSSGDFDMILFAWVGTPFATNNAQGIYELKGGSDYGKNDDPAMEQLLNTAGEETDPTQVNVNLNKADVLLTADAYNLPLFQKPTFLAAYANIANIRDNASTFGPPYNAQSWGIRSS